MTDDLGLSEHSPGPLERAARRSRDAAGLASPEGLGQHPGHPVDPPEGDRMFTFRCGTSGASVTCHHCGWRVTGRWPKDVYPKAELHTCGGRSRT